MLAVDMSNYTSELTPTALEGLRSAGVGHVIIQAIDPPPGYPVGRTRAQVQACIDAGLTVDAYVWLWFDLDIADVRRKLRLLDGLSIRQLWLDVEDTAAVKYDQPTTEAKIAEALAECDAYPTLSRERTGVYSGRWFWADRRYVANSTTFSDRELWDANYDDVADAALGFAPYGGWQRVAIKQYRGTSVLAGIGGLDLNVLSVEKVGDIFPPEPAPAPTNDSGTTPVDDSGTTPSDDSGTTPGRETPTDWQWPTWREAAINYKAIADELGKQLAAAQHGQPTPA
jgi:hypothetical protein